MSEFEVTVEFEVICQECGVGLRHKSEPRFTVGRSMQYISAYPCTSCIEAVKAEENERGYDLGYREGYDLGYREWYNNWSHVDA